MAAPCALCPRSQCEHTLVSVYQARVVFMFGAVRYPMSPGTPHVRPFHHTTPSPAAGLRQPPQRARGYPLSGAATCHYGNANPGGGATAGAGCRALHYSSRFGCRKETYMPRARAPEEWLCACHAGDPSGVAACAGRARVSHRGTTGWVTWRAGGAPRLQVGLSIQSGRDGIC